MDQRYRISVLMGIYNCSQTLVEALESLFSQTCDCFKIILCDDGSSDNTYEIAKIIAEKHHNVILIKNESNEGLNYTLNHCLKYVDTEYVARMDGDDISLPTRFEKEMNFLDNNPEIDIVSCAMIYFDEEGDFKIGKVVEYPQKKDFLKGTPICHAPCMIRTRALRSVNGYSVGEKLLRVEDYHLWMKLYAKGSLAYNFKEPLYKMRDDRNARKRRTWKNRLNEMYVRHIGFNLLGLPWYAQIFVLRPLIVYITPSWLYNLYHR